MTMGGGLDDGGRMMGNGEKMVTDGDGNEAMGLRKRR